MLLALSSEGFIACCWSSETEEGCRSCVQGRRIQDVAYRMHVATPAPRDRQVRPPVIPASVAAAQSRAAAVESKKKTEKDLQVLPCWNSSARSFPQPERASQVERQP